jgi:hypothetical protein
MVNDLQSQTAMRLKGFSLFAPFLFALMALNWDAYADSSDAPQEFQGLDVVKAYHSTRGALDEAREASKPRHPSRRALEARQCQGVALNVMPKTRDFVLGLDEGAFKNSEENSFDWTIGRDSGRPSICQVSAYANQLSELVIAIREARKLCTTPCITSLNLDSHGSSGRLWSGADVFMFGKSEVAALSDEEKLEIQNAFAPHAVIRFLGCEIAKDRRGAKFLTEVGRSMLSTHGGEVRAFTNPALTNVFAQELRNSSMAFGSVGHFIQPAGGGEGRYFLSDEGINTL